MMSKSNSLNLHRQANAHRTPRRRFLKSLATAAIAPVVIPASALGRDGHTAPSERITMGLVGSGDHGSGWNLDRMFANKDQQVVAVCDVDSSRVKTAAAKVNAHYSKESGGDYRCDTYADFRDLINRKDIDAVDVATPDHWHVIPALMALKSGKHVICEKPLSLTIAEGRILADAAKASGKVFQTASENRSVESYIRMVELVKAGVFGEIKHVKILLPPSNRQRKEMDPTLGTPPPQLDYEMWQGQAPEMPYYASRVHYNFRWNLAYSGGIITDWGAHMIDLAHWATGNELTGPVEMEGAGVFPPRDGIWNTAETFKVHYRYPSGLTTELFTDAPGLKFEGTKGWLLTRGWRGPMQSDKPELLDTALNAEQTLRRPRTDGSGGEHMEFTDAIKEGRQAYAPAEIGHRTITVAHLGNIAMMLGRKLQWDPAQEAFVNDPEANAMRSREQRGPWTIENVDSWLNVG
ncbi:Gfo/Idh/MocA family protein [Novipirellula artificiosorum]|uniref:Inositol 2-dehydrogenase n=1 Tax=Novipirellula artificiosorum TaxID=2528016 RepID=A0A5C6DMC5_9BACT|nr:Gfo/Idh/MocA family oxidoreductase [Novipirellula artificiosorum]TWU36009.1 Inositol 2-dehydrogenase [Novipirellula artificiosorum]